MKNRSGKQQSSSERFAALTLAAAAGRGKPSTDEIAQRAYAIYLKEGCPRGRDVQNWLEAETELATSL